MSATLQAYQFRCTNCYQVVQLDTAAAGSQVSCPWCTAPIEAPEATEDQLCDATTVAASPVNSAASLAAPTGRQSIEELKEAARQRAKTAERNPRGCGGRPDRLCCSRLSRLVAYIIDLFGFVVSQLMGAVPVICLGLLDVIQRPTVSAYAEFMCRKVPIAALTRDWSDVQSAVAAFSSDMWIVMGAVHSVVVVFLICQAWGVAQQGQSFGKRVMRIRIVNTQGEPPGFFSGVVVRSVLVNGLGIAASFVLSEWPAFFVRLLCLANIAAICLEPPRCLHDRIAGTYVIRA